MSHVRSDWFFFTFKPFNFPGNGDDCGAAGSALRRRRAGRVQRGGSADRGSGSGRHPRPAPLGGGILGSSGHHQQRGFGESGGLRHVQPDPLGGAVVSRQRQSLARSCSSAAPHQPAGAGPGPHAGADEQQAPAPGFGHPVDIQWGFKRRPGTGHFRHSRHRHPAHGSAARRGGGSVRLRRHRRRAELRPEGRGRGSLAGSPVRRVYGALRRGHDLHRRQCRVAAGQQRFRELQLRVRGVRTDRPQRPARRRHRPDRPRHSQRRRAGEALGLAHRQRQHQGRGEHRCRRERQQRTLRLRQLRQPRGLHGVLLPQPDEPQRRLQDLRQQVPGRRRGLRREVRRH